MKSSLLFQYAWSRFLRFVVAAELLILTALAFSLTGGLLALGTMALLLRCGRFSLFGVSIAGAAAHNTGQILAAMAVLGSRAPLAYLPPLLLCSLATGAFTGGVSAMLVRRIPAPLRAD